ncbi:MAG: hypothetical protein B7Y49_09650 [Sphingomonas sp. 28-62-11]|nr:MAG: hypothetical protein B7Y49_09650 [Sphingomonas sp. 28-62-11]
MQTSDQLFLGMLLLPIISLDMEPLSVILLFIAPCFIMGCDPIDDPCIFIIATQLRFFIIAECDIAWQRFIVAACDLVICADAEEAAANERAIAATARAYFVIFILLRLPREVPQLRQTYNQTEFTDGVLAQNV